MEKDFKFNITVAGEDNKLQGKQLKYAIDHYHFLIPGTTKCVKWKETETMPDNDGVS